MSWAGEGTPAGTACPRAACQLPTQQHGEHNLGDREAAPAALQRLRAAGPCQGCTGQCMQRGQHGVRQGNSEPKAPRWHSQHTESISYLAPSNLGSRLWKERKRDLPREWQEDSGPVPSTLLGKVHCGPLPRPAMLPAEMGLRWGPYQPGTHETAGVLWGHPLRAPPRLPLQPKLAVPLHWPHSPEIPWAEPTAQEHQAVHRTQ